MLIVVLFLSILLPPVKSFEMPESPDVNILMKALRVYAGEHVLERVMQQGEKAFSREGKSAILTLMFIEIDTLHTQSNKSFSEQQLAAINSSLSTVAECIYNHKGVIDSFNGVTVFAYWGLNGEVGHEKQASRCALDCVASIAKLSQKNEKAGLPTIRIRVGIDTGNLFVGNIGSDQRMKFAVLGDHVNTAYGLTGMCRSYPDTQVLISQSTRNRLDDSFSPLLVGNVRIKGREEPLSLFSLRDK